MLILDKGQVEQATAVMATAAQLPISVLEEPHYRHQVTAFIVALAKNHKAEQVYRGLWREVDDPFSDLQHHLEHKAARLKRHLHNMSGPFVMDDPELGHSEKGHEEQIFSAAMDDLLDIINYAGFLAQLVHEQAERLGLELSA
jgi:hypothetical protein